MDSPYVDDRTVSLESLAELLTLRWKEACGRLKGLDFFVPTWEIGESLHFSSPRGFATTSTDGSFFHLKLAGKIIGQPFHRVDAIVRHEIGHIVDFCGVGLPEGLPVTPERRADAIAELVWGTRLCYDADEVQTVLSGVHPRPEHLGL